MKKDTSITLTGHGVPARVASEGRGTTQLGATAVIADDRGRALYRLAVEIVRVDWQARTLTGRVRRIRGLPPETVTYDLVTGTPSAPALRQTHGVLSQESVRNLSRKRLQTAQLPLMPGDDEP